ncbi:PLP-dependent aminotransferase family protein [Candidimonas humi]|uniref:PLP-dependent aminotransferase family protein n=1 Tax=Candidimonas humi TaxID=683355 RepID=A0ABV8P291_9BURK|nr:PLP-dependent aminotransferase family protein [Candidimonas humi]MBV6306523.1 PLP-dependent aminotransferase family protein [Candidimonas humi]
MVRDPTATAAADPESEPLYRRLARQYSGYIAAGTLRPGDRMPSMRDFMRRHGVSLATATETYRSLEREGLVHARPRSGYFVQRGRSAQLPAVAEPTPAIPDCAQFVGVHSKVSAVIAMCQAAPQALNLGGANAAAPELYPAEALRKLATAALRHNPQLLTATGIDPGNEYFRRMVARRALDAGVQLAPDEVIVTHGGIEAVNLILRAVTRPGDTVAIESPCFSGLLQVQEALGLRALEIPTSPSTGLVVEALELALQTYDTIKAVVVMPNLHNPLGCSMPDAHKARLVELCSRSGVALIEDESYRDLADASMPLKPLKAWDTDGTVIYCVSLNKTLAPGMRLGWMNGGRWHARIGMLKSAQGRSNEEWPQVVAAQFIQSRAYDRHLQRLKHHMRLLRARAAEAIAASFPPGTRFTPPEGGVTFWLELPAAVDALRLFEIALGDGLCIMPGTIFSNSGRYDHFIRLSCGLADPDLLDRSIRRVGMLARELADDGQSACQEAR